MKKYVLYTDGSCKRNGSKGASAPGGWAYLVLDKTGIKTKECSGSIENTTNNRMEMQAVIEGLKHLEFKRGEIEVRSDSHNIIKAFNEGWVNKWMRNGWTKKKWGEKEREPIANKDLWLELKELVDRTDASFTYVEGHSDDKYNSRVNVLAGKEAVQLK